MVPPTLRFPLIVNVTLLFASSPRFPPIFKVKPAGRVKVELPPLDIPNPPLTVKFLFMIRFELFDRLRHKLPVYDVLPLVGHPVPVHVSEEKFILPEPTFAVQLQGET